MKLHYCDYNGNVTVALSFNSEEEIIIDGTSIVVLEMSSSPGSADDPYTGSADCNITIVSKNDFLTEKENKRFHKCNSYRNLYFKAWPICIGEVEAAYKYLMLGEDTLEQAQIKKARRKFLFELNDWDWVDSEECDDEDGDE